MLQELDIPDKLKSLYKTVWEIKQRVLVDMAADRGAYIDQSQSFNVHMSDPNFGKLTSLHFYAWKKGLKTGAVQGRAGCWARGATKLLAIPAMAACVHQSVNVGAGLLYVTFAPALLSVA